MRLPEVPPVLVRDVQEQELPQLLALLEASASFDGAAHSLVATVETLRQALFSNAPMARAIVAVVGDELVGTATYYATFSSFLAKPCLWLDDLFVYEALRSKGIGRALVKHVCKIAYAQGCGRVDWVVATQNANGRGFYTRLGASIFESVRLARLEENAIRALATEDA